MTGSNIKRRVLTTMEKEKKVGTDKKTLKKRLKRYIPIYFMALPGLIYLFINNYMPLPGLVLAFKKFNDIILFWIGNAY